MYAPEADGDLEGIVDYIARDKPNAARDWLAKIRRTCETLATQPDLAATPCWLARNLTMMTTRIVLSLRCRWSIA
ncbi:MAG: type II toxin-antitoxin system RelE/ParE family toxin [Planctomycetota bacterium]|nr:type II toxin-antitoxin system RelE/ParE family toxin [Planctomycetota bacterium]